MKISSNTIDKIYLNKSPLASTKAPRRLRHRQQTYSCLNCLSDILAFSSSLVLDGVLLVTRSTPQIIIKGIAILEIRQPGVKGDLVTDIFSWLILGSFGSVMWLRVLLPDEVFQ